jgi:predicted metalloprotease
VTVPSRRRFARAATLGVPVATALALALAGCTQVVAGSAAPAPLPATAAVAAPVPAAAPGPSPSDAIAEAAAASLQEFWASAFPAAFGREWDDVDIFAAVHTGDPGAPPPPCVNRTSDIERQAFYCPAADAVAWDADGLLPALHEQFGPAGVAVVLAHEVGHAVQTRLGVDDAQAREPDRFPTILLEAMADCYAGVAVAHFVQQPVADVPIALPDRDEALRALVGFSDPLGVDSADRSAHGNAFDRVSAFQDGYGASTGGSPPGGVDPPDMRWAGAARCAEMSLENREFTQRRFGSEADAARGGDLPLPQLLPAVESDARGWFGGLLPGWRVPGGEPAASCPGRAATAQGPVAYCAASGVVTVDRDGLAGLHSDLGDFAGATLLASRYGIALLAATGRAATGTAAGAAATCLAGAYTAGLIDSQRGFRLSPGDLDEAVQVLLVGDWAARDAAGVADPADHGFERVARFRTGVLEGPRACVPG